MKYPGLNISRRGAENVSGIWQFYLERGNESQAFESIREILRRGLKVCLADHSRGDCEGAYCISLTDGEFEVCSGGHGYTSEKWMASSSEIREIFDAVCQYNYGDSYYHMGVIRQKRLVIMVGVRAKP